MNDIKRLNLITETVSGSQSKVYAEVKNKRFVLANLTKFKAKFKVNSVKKGVLGMNGKQSKPSGWKGTWDASFYYNSSILVEVY